MTTNHTSYVYVGLAGETAPGRVVKSGLYRMAVGDDRWEPITRGLPEAPAIRAIATHPENPELVYVGTQNGPYRSTDQGEHWEKLNVPDNDHLVIRDIEQRFVNQLIYIRLVAAGQETETGIDALRCVQQSITSGILAELRQDRADLFNHPA